MPARIPPAAEQPIRTPSFVCEVPLRVSRAQERRLLARLEAARQVYNACLGEARRRGPLGAQAPAVPPPPGLPPGGPAPQKRLSPRPGPHPVSRTAPPASTPAHRDVSAGGPP